MRCNVIVFSPVAQQPSSGIEDRLQAIGRRERHAIGRREGHAIGRRKGHAIGRREGQAMGRAQRWQQI